jgi:NTP pyrophosphatase (non-canonical NTP hydrolase)
MTARVKAGPKRPEDEPETDEERLSYFVEETGEVLAAVGKSLRWGLASFNPELPPEKQELNRDWVRLELNDLRAAIKRLEKVL